MKNQYNAAKASNEEANTAFISAKQEANQIKETVNTILDQFEIVMTNQCKLEVLNYNQIKLFKMNACYTSVLS